MQGIHPSMHTSKKDSKNNVKDRASYFYLMTAYAFAQNEQNTNNEREYNVYE